MPWFLWPIFIGIAVGIQILLAFWIDAVYNKEPYTEGYRDGRDDEARVRGDRCSNFTIERDGI